MGYLGYKPADKPLTAADITDGVITTAKIADGAVVNADIANSTINLTTKVTGTLPYTNGGTGLATLGTAGQALVVNSGATALQYSTVGASAGTIIQVVSTTITSGVSSSSTSFTDVTGLSVSLTPSSTSSKVVILVSGSGYSPANTAHFNVSRNGTNLFDSTQGYIAYGAGFGSIALCHLDSPSTVSSVTYKLRFRCTAGTCNVGATSGDADCDTFITIMEVKG
jgi:hypothetical protein